MFRAGIPNDALVRLAVAPAEDDDTGTTREFLKHFKVYTGQLLLRV